MSVSATYSRNKIRWKSSYLCTCEDMRFVEDCYEHFIHWLTPNILQWAVEDPNLDELHGFR